jgi:hypothetical protein
MKYPQLEQGLKPVKSAVVRMLAELTYQKVVFVSTASNLRQTNQELLRMLQISRTEFEDIKSENEALNIKVEKLRGLLEESRAKQEESDRLHNEQIAQLQKNHINTQELLAQMQIQMQKQAQEMQAELQKQMREMFSKEKND